MASCGYVPPDLRWVISSSPAIPWVGADTDASNSTLFRKLGVSIHSQRKRHASLQTGEVPNRYFNGDGSKVVYFHKAGSAPRTALSKWYPEIRRPAAMK